MEFEDDDYILDQELIPYRYSFCCCSSRGNIFKIWEDGPSGPSYTYIQTHTGE